jgi:L-threonylcarbamoyladenylate synthase
MATIISQCSLSVLRQSAEKLKAGDLIAFPTETVYGLGVDAENQSAVARMYQVKNRPANHPVIVHIAELKDVDYWAKEIPEYAIKLARTFWPGPMTLVLPRTDLAKDFITGDQDNVAIRVPSHPLATSLLKDFEDLGGLGVAAPSANRFGKVSPTTADAVFQELSDFLSPTDLILDGGPSQVGVESTIINCTQSVPEILRPGAITSSMIHGQIGLIVSQRNSNNHDIKLKVPGSLQSHYAPIAKVFLSTIANPGDGFIALSNTPTPPGVIRLASPTNNREYAQILYQALRLADTKKLQKVIVIPPTGDDLALAIIDRLQKCKFKEN